MERLIATRFQLREQFNDKLGEPPVMFDRMLSPFYRGERWAVRRGSACLGKDGWEWEPQPSSRDDEFYARCRFPTMEAALLAYDAAQEPTP